jgi:hypothetical protein
MKREILCNFAESPNATLAISRRATKAIAMGRLLYFKEKIKRVALI